MSQKRLRDLLRTQLDDLKAKGLYKRERQLQSPQGAAIKVAEPSAEDGTRPNRRKVREGIVVSDAMSATVVVAVVAPGRGPVFRTVHPNALTERTQERPDDPALRLLIRRTPPPVHGTDSGAMGMGRRHAGHTRGSMHRTTGK